ncbi:MAG: cytochrome c maturation protein CcmE [Chloroflexi bacterium]|nr:cytochrome c maturation protein CcmE [Chloroflexota bacterium]
MRHPARALITGGLLIMAVLGFLVYQGLSNNLVYYITPSELHARGTAADGQSFRLGGQVRPGSVHWNASTQALRFILQDPRGWVSVASHGTPPELFRPGAGVVVEGTFTGSSFQATNLMIKHGSDYRAPKPGATPVPDGLYRAR